MDTRLEVCPHSISHQHPIMVLSFLKNPNFAAISRRHPVTFSCVPTVTIHNYINDTEEGDGFAFVRVIWCNHHSHSIAFLEPPARQASHRTDKFYKGSYISTDVLTSDIRLQCKTAVVKTAQDAVITLLRPTMKTSATYYFPRCAGPLKRGASVPLLPYRLIRHWDEACS